MAASLSGGRVAAKTLPQDDPYDDDARYADVFPGSALLDQLEHVVAHGIAIHDHRGLALQPLPREDGTTGGVAIFAMDAQRLRA